ncbi:E3 ubiquitin-protein ligase RNF25 [Hyposmocoma kahamanoa]|uniref:E3 ubiquitin-protein ligase RNF25 n=1 Tax=Hyposmocoma kahamanoa TaxID=1477025 RepID=UPI000E6D5B0B|nr:E3 ubiquitin-protein ligase RNF25 [Hyposmocoma kahamanoa]
MSISIDERVTDEVEALQAILMDDVKIKMVDGVPEIIETIVHPSTGDNTDQQFVCVTLEVKLTPGYPEKSPEVFLRNPRGLDDDILDEIKKQVKQKLEECLGQPVVFELIGLIRENLTESNLPSGQCVICLYGFAEGDVFIKTQCYHYFHSRCLASHLIAGKENYEEEVEKLPHWQKISAPPYQQTCPVCRSNVQCDVDALKTAPPSVDSISAPPFRLTAELKALQLKMAALLAQQVAKGGVVGVGDTGPPPLTITTPADHDAAANGSSSSAEGAKAAAIVAPRPAPPPAASASDAAAAEPTRRVPYRGFNRRGKPGRRGRGAGAAR